MEHIVLTKLHPDAKSPVRATEHSVGFDITCVEGHSIPPGETVLFDTGLQLTTLKSGILAQLTSRSGLAIKKGIVCIHTTLNTGDVIKVPLYNTSIIRPVLIEEGERIAQLILLPAVAPYLILKREASVPTQQTC